MIKIVSAIINKQMYRRFFTENSYVNSYDLVPVDNTSANLGLPTIYNSIIEASIDSEAWLFFVHEDFEIKSGLDVIHELDKNYIYGTCGVKLYDTYPVGYGRHTCSNKSGSNPRVVGEVITEPVEVETLDCQSILVHSSLFKKLPKLRFDETLRFHLYAEDICIYAKRHKGIKSYVFPLEFQHYSYGNLSREYLDGLEYLAKKYPDIGVPGSCSFIGGNVTELEKNFEYRVGTVELDIEKYDVFCFDIFDTAIIRLLAKPTDLFKVIGMRHGISGFCNDRIKKEAKTRKQYPKKRDVSIYEIYCDFPYDVNIEIATEIEFCFANPEIFQKYQEIVSAGKKVFFISDMYLPKDVLEKILTSNGYDKYEDVFVSSEDDLLKGDGSRFAWLQNFQLFKSSKIIHVGDNRVSDFLMPIRHGFDSFHYKDKSRFLKADSFIGCKYNYFEESDTLGSSFILSSYHLWSLKNQSFTTKSYWERFGFFYGGALVVSFCYYINSIIKLKGSRCKNLYFLARDGDILKSVYDLLFENSETKYLWASRRCMALPALTTLLPEDDADQLIQFCNPVGVDIAKDIVNRFNYSDLDSFEKGLAKKGGTFTESAIYGCLFDEKEQILQKASKEREILLDYLKSEGLLDEKEVFLVDVGWGGSIQDSLSKIINTIEGHNKDIFGIYIGVNDSARAKEFKNGFLFEKDFDRFRDYIELIELLTSSPQDPVIRIEKVNDAFRPVTMEANEEEQKRQEASFFIQKGIIEFAVFIKENSIGPVDFLSDQDFKTLFGSLRFHPSQNDILYLNGLRHAMAIGNNYNRGILPSSFSDENTSKVEFIKEKFRVLLFHLRRGNFSVIRDAIVGSLRRH